MKLIVGLGNHGVEYARTFHNAGFMVVDELSKRLRDDLRVTRATRKTRRLFESEEFRFQHTDGTHEHIALLKSQTFMNESGLAVAAFCRTLTSPIDPKQDVWIVHDDGDIALGSVRIDVGKRAAGHRGVQSIQNVLGALPVVRVRVGIRRAGETRQTSAFVLKKPRVHDQALFDDGVFQAAAGIITALAEGIPKAQNMLHQKK